MEQKKLFIGLALVIAVLALGVAYASITTQTLNVAGTATAEASNDNFNVVFEGEVPNSKSATVGTNVNSAVVTASANGKSGNFSISKLDTEGEYVTITYPIVNKSPDLAAKLKNIQITNSDNTKAWWDITANIAKTDLAANGDSASLVITVTLKDTPANDEEAPTGNFHVSFDADPV